MLLIQNKNYNHKNLESDSFQDTVFKKVQIKFTSLINLKFFNCNLRININYKKLQN